MSTTLGTIYRGTGIGGRRAGVASATIDGEAVDIVGDLTYDVTDVKRETLTGQSSVQGYSEMPKAPQIKMTLRDARNFSVASLMAKRSASVVVITATGKTVSGDGMWCVEVAAVNTAEGSLEVTFEGIRVTER